MSKSKQLFMDERERVVDYASDAKSLANKQEELPPSNIHPLFQTMIISFGDVNRQVYVHNANKKGKRNER
jgi:hypothetical protein